jgi:hypothetical protein
MLISLAACLVVPLLLVCWSSRGSLRHSPWPAAAAAVVYGSQLLRTAYYNIRHPHEWDYACFWLYGHVAAAHRNIYDPASYAGWQLPMPLSDGFRRAVLDVGFPYPPPTIALFLPLGFIDNVPLGLALWYGAQFAALAAAAWVLGRTFWPAAGWKAALLVFALLAALPASLMNVGDAQTNFLVLLLLALGLAGRGTPAGAVWEVLAIWVKPYAALLLLLDAAGRRGRRLVVAGVTLVVSLAAGAIAVGPAALASYLRANPSTREPSEVFVEIVNQSLLAAVLRLHAVLPDRISPLHEPLYVAGAVLLVVATAVLCTRANVPEDAAFCAMLLTGLILYPGALSSYGVVLIVPLLVVWRHRAAFPGEAAGVAALAALAVLLQSGALQRGLEANVLLWIACAYLLAARREVREPLSGPARGTAAGMAG